MNRKRQLSSLLGGLLAFLLLLIVWVVAALHLTSAAASPLDFPFNLRSSLDADYGPDPLGARIYELRLSIVGELSSGSEGEAASLPDSLRRAMSLPVPSATPRPPTPTKSTVSTEMPAPASTQAPTETPSPTLAPTETPSRTPTPGAGPFSGPEPDCSNLQITNTWIDDGDELRALVRNENSRRAYLTRTVFEWPDVPTPAYVDWMRFDDRYYDNNDYSSPTISEGSWETLKGNSSETWRADFDDEPKAGIYGNFQVSLTFVFPGWGSCVIDGSTFRPQPSPTPTKLPSPTRTPTPTKTPTPGVAPSAIWTETVEPTAAPSVTPVEPTATEPSPTATP